jgi:hypothetical protein
MYIYMHILSLINERIQSYFLGSIVGLASVMTDAQTAFDNCALENCPTELAAPRLREVCICLLMYLYICIYIYIDI